MIAPRQLLAGGTFVQGDDHHYPEEGPARPARVQPFEIDRHPVTNAQFAAFVTATGHRTAAERDGAAVFVPAAAPVDLGQPSLWWRHAPDASWRRPTGEAALKSEHGDHPVVNVAVMDAQAYAEWCGGRLPTEAEWEYAALGGLPLAATWPLAADGMLLANVWLGEFPWRSVRTTAPGTTPVGAYRPNAYGLFDMLGNVWELTADTWSLPHMARPTGAPSCCQATGGVPADHDAVVAKGGSFLCAANYCKRYRPAARHRQPIDEAACHIGFRCAYDLGTAGTDGDAAHG